MIRFIVEFGLGLAFAFCIAFVWVLAWLVGQSDYGPGAFWIVLFLIFRSAGGKDQAPRRDQDR